MAMHPAIFLPLPLLIVFVIALSKAKTTKQREIAAAGLLLGFALIAGASALLGYGR